MAWTTPRTWTDAEFVTAAIMNQHVRDEFNAIGPQYPKMKAADETVNNSTTLQNDDDFVFPVLANEKWAVDMAVKVESSTTADWKYNFTVPAGTTFEFASLAGNPPGFIDYTSTTQAISSTSAANPVRLQAFFLVSSTAGNVQFQWAQNTLEASNTRVKAGSWMHAFRCS